MYALKKNILIHLQSLVISNNYPIFMVNIIIVSLFFLFILLFVSVSVVLPKQGVIQKFFGGGAKCSRSEHRTREARSNLSWGVWGGGAL